MLKIREHWKVFDAIHESSDREAAWEVFVRASGVEDIYDAVPHHMAAALTRYLMDSMGPEPEAALEGVTVDFVYAEPADMEVTFEVIKGEKTMTAFVNQKDPSILVVSVLAEPVVQPVKLVHPFTGELLDTLTVESVAESISSGDLEVEVLRLPRIDLRVLEEVPEDLVRRLFGGTL